MKEAYYFDPAAARTNTTINLPSERTLARRSNTGPLSVGGYRYTGLAPIICSKPVIFEQFYSSLTRAFVYRSKVNHGTPCAASAHTSLHHSTAAGAPSIRAVRIQHNTTPLSAEHLQGLHKPCKRQGSTEKLGMGFWVIWSWERGETAVLAGGDQFFYIFEIIQTSELEITKFISHRAVYPVLILKHRITLTHKIN